MYEGGTRSPFIVKEPGVPSLSSSSSNMRSPKIIKAFAYVEDITPTILEHVGVNHPGFSYNGHEVQPIMGKSLKALINGTVDKVYGENEAVADEMFNNTVIWMGIGKPKGMNHQWVMENGN